MKIKINENETYEINISEEILNAKQFQELLFRLNAINKILGRDILMSSITEKPTPKIKTYTNQRKPSKSRPWAKDREFVVDLIKLHYLGSKEMKEKKTREMNMTCWDEIVKAIHNLVMRHNITPAEIGIPFFPVRYVEGKSIFDLREAIKEKDLKYTSPTSNIQEDKYEAGIIHFDINNRYGCNPSVNPNLLKLSKDWSKITCSSCTRKFGENNNATKNEENEEKEE